MRALPGALRRGLLFMFSPCCLKFPSAPPSSPGLSELYRLLYDKVPYRARFRSDKHATVLRLQSTQPKNRRVYTALTGILTKPQAVWRKRKGIPGRRSRPLRIFIYTRYYMVPSAVPISSIISSTACLEASA